MQIPWLVFTTLPVFQGATLSSTQSAPPPDMSEMMALWKIDDYMANNGNNQTLKTSLMKAMEKEMEHEAIIRRIGRTIKFRKSTDLTAIIAFNYNMMKSLQKVVENGAGQGDDHFLEMCQALNANLTDDAPCNTAICDPNSDFRQFSGCCNNVANRKLGSTLQPFNRALPNAYQDGRSKPRGDDPSSLPNPRLISSTVFGTFKNQTQKETKPTNSLLLTFQFGQFLDHDITLTPEQELPCCNVNETSCFNINVTSDLFYSGKTKCLPFTRSDAICQSEVREQFNANSAFIDASMIYGSDEETAKRLRTMKNGKIKTHEGPTLPTLPTRKQCDFETHSPEEPEDLVAGDVRAIEQPGLASMHTIFVLLHNRIADFFHSYQLGTSDERVYQETRKLVGAIIQNIVYNEFLPEVLGEENVEKFNLKLPADPEGNTIYDPTVDPTIENEFATAAFRFGHSLIPNMFLLSPDPLRTSNRCPLMQNFNKFQDCVIGDDTSGRAWQNMLVGMASQERPAQDVSINNNVLDFLFCDEAEGECSIPGGWGQDLGARNIQRGRDHGIPPYIKFREMCNLIVPQDCNDKPEDINADTWEKICNVYNSNVGEIDLFVGGLAEEGSTDGTVGSTFACLIGRQFEKLMKGDRFFFANSNEGTVKGLPPRTKANIRSITLRDIVCWVTGELNCPNGQMLDMDTIVDDIFQDALLVTGGVGAYNSEGRGVRSSVEVFFPESGRKCSLQPLPHDRWSHTLDTLPLNRPIICGGAGSDATLTSCLYLPSPTSPWTTINTTLATRRHEHSSLIDGDDVILIGGGYHGNTIETLQPGNVNTNVRLRYYYRDACAIQDGNTVVLTGGRYSMNRVSVFNREGHGADWPNLQEGRRNHGCGSYIHNGARIYVVAGGWNGSYPYPDPSISFDSTETLTAGSSAWSYGAKLPSRYGYMASVSRGNIIYLIGGTHHLINDKRSEVMKYENSKWTQVGTIQRARDRAAATMVKMDVNVCG